MCVSVRASSRNLVCYQWINIKEMHLFIYLVGTIRRANAGGKKKGAVSAADGFDGWTIPVKKGRYEGVTGSGGH